MAAGCLAARVRRLLLRSSAASSFSDGHLILHEVVPHHLATGPCEGRLQLLQRLEVVDEDELRHGEWRTRESIYLCAQRRAGHVTCDASQCASFFASMSSPISIDIGKRVDMWDRTRDCIVATAPTFKPLQRLEVVDEDELRHGEWRTRESIYMCAQRRAGLLYSHSASWRQTRQLCSQNERLRAATYI